MLPAYGSGSLTEVLPGVLTGLGLPDLPDPLGLSSGPLAGARRVAVLLVDGLGTHVVPRSPALAFAAGAPVITAGFPSTTPVSLVTLGTGAPPGAHGVLGFNVRVPATQRVLNHIVWHDDPDPRVWQPVPTLLDRACAAGLPVTIVSRPEFAGSGLTVAAYGSAAGYRGAADLDELAAGMLGALDTSRLVYGYHADLDKTGHLYGLASPEWAAAAAGVGRLVGRLVEGLPPDAALVVTADHGQLDVPADGRFDLDTDPRLAAGVELVAGEARVRYLHVTPGAVADVVAAWRAVLGDRARVLTREEAVATGWYGPVAPGHLARIGDVVVVCLDPSTVVVASRTEPDFVARMVAFHGSVSEPELAVPLVVVPPR